MHFDTLHTQTSRLDWSEVITCPGCRTKWKARVKVKASGTGRAHYGIGQEDAHDRAGVSAFSNASEAGAALIRRAKCPRCGQRSGGLFSLAFQSIAITAVLGWLSYRWLPERLGGFLAVAGVLVITPLLIWYGLSQAERRVSFEPINEVPEHLVRRDSQRALDVPEPLAPPPDVDQPVATTQAPGAEPELELDVDRSWNKK